MNVETDVDYHWLYMAKSGLKSEPNAPSYAALEQALRMNYMKCTRITINTSNSYKGKMRGEKF